MDAALSGGLGADSDSTGYFYIAQPSERSPLLALPRLDQDRRRGLALAV